MSIIMLLCLCARSGWERRHHHRRHPSRGRDRMPERLLHGSAPCGIVFGGEVSGFLLKTKAWIVEHGCRLLRRTGIRDVCLTGSTYVSETDLRDDIKIVYVFTWPDFNYIHGCPGCLPVYLLTGSHPALRAVYCVPLQGWNVTGHRAAN